ncbi:MAG TPA: GspE/PulE family protein [Opitutaceae bacterium]|nr:GspE/PulE family protein [Opitutaceae bacterium]
MLAGHDQAVAALLRARHLLPAETLAALRTECAATGRPLAAAVVGQGWVGREAFVAALAAHLGLPAATAPEELPPGLVELVPGGIARRYGVVPVRAGGRWLELAAADPFAAGPAGDLAFALGREVRLAVADPDAVARLLHRYYGAPEAGAAEGAGAADLAQAADAAPVVRFVDQVLAQAVRDRASDVHFEPFEGEFKVRGRVDGTLRELAAPPPGLAPAVVSRLKVLAGLNIAERRVPQDGRLRVAADGRSVDLRVATLPTQAGESVVLRVLDPAAVPLELGELGLGAAVESGVRAALARPNGIILVTGPTGSGKTTTLYSCLRLLNRAPVKILTAEDPVEYEIEGVMQLAVNPGIGLTFAAALRSFLRQDPDVLMVGEIRDLETAQIAIQAALTGHLVLSTLHTNDAPGAVTRLIDMGVEPYLLAATLEAVLAQRLVRGVCPGCRESAPVPAALLAELAPEADALAGREVGRGHGCAACRQTGCRGRGGIFEWLRFDEPLRELMLQRAPAALLKQRARERGMETLREAGVRAVAEGRTSLEEVARCP